MCDSRYALEGRCLEPVDLVRMTGSIASALGRVLSSDGRADRGRCSFWRSWNELCLETEWGRELSPRRLLSGSLGEADMASRLRLDAL